MENVNNYMGVDMNINVNNFINVINHVIFILLLRRLQKKEEIVEGLVA